MFLSLFQFLLCHHHVKKLFIKQGKRKATFFISHHLGFSLLYTRLDFCSRIGEGAFLQSSCFQCIHQGLHRNHYALHRSQSHFTYALHVFTLMRREEKSDGCKCSFSAASQNVCVRTRSDCIFWSRRNQFAVKLPLYSTSRISPYQQTV